MIAATRAASSPPGPPPTTTTFEALAAGSSNVRPPQSRSRKLAGLIEQPCAPSQFASMHQLQVMQVRLRSSLPSRALRTRSGSAISARAAPTMSQMPDSRIASASSIDVSRPITLSTGTSPTAPRIASTYGL